MTLNIRSAYPIDFHIGDYVVYRGEKFVLPNDPSVVKKARRGTYGEGFTYDGVKFCALHYELTDIEFLDYVLDDNELHWTGLPSFPFYANNIDDYCDRLQANTNRWCQDNGMAVNDYWLFVTPDYDRTIQRAAVHGMSTSTARAIWEGYFGTNHSSPRKYVEDEKTLVDVSVDNETIWNALTRIKSDFGLNFISRGRHVVIGMAAIETTHLFEYGKGNGLYEIERVADEDQQVVTKMRGYGSDKNMPVRYYANIDVRCYGLVTESTEQIALTDIPWNEVSLFGKTTTTGMHTVSIEVNGTAYSGVVVRRGGNYLCIDYTASGDLPAMADGARVYFTKGIVADNWPVSRKTGTDANLPNMMSVNRLMMPGFPKMSLYAWVLANGGTAVSDSGNDSRKGLATWKGHRAYFSKEQYDPYVVSPNYKDLGIRESSTTFDGSDENEEIYPTIEGTGLDVLVAAEAVTDGGVFGDGADVPTVTLTLPDFGSDFDLKAMVESGTTQDGGKPAISMRDGYCGGRTFAIKSAKQNANGTWEVVCEREYDDLQERYFPYAHSGSAYQVSSGDSYVLTGIPMTSTYINANADRLLEETLKALEKNDYTRYTYLPKVDEIFMANEHQEKTLAGLASLHDTLKEGDVMTFADGDLGINGGVFIDTLHIKEDGNKGIPTYEVTLREEKQVGTIERMQEKINSIGSDQAGSIAGRQLARKVDTAFFEQLFTAYDENDNPISVNTYGQTPNHIEFRVGAWTKAFLSALGLGNKQGNGGATALKDLVDVTIDTPQAGQVLGWDSETSHWVPMSVQGGTGGIDDGIDETKLGQYLTNNHYATQQWVGQQGYLTAHQSLAGYATEQWVKEQGYLTSYAEQYMGTVTSVGLSMPTGFAVGGSPVTGSGTLTVAFADGYSLPTTQKQKQWDDAYGWGNHASAGYLKSITAAMIITALGFTLSGTANTTYNLATIASNAANGNTAYNWGNHATAGYAKATDLKAVSDLLNDLFTKESDGNGGWRIKANYGLYTEQFLSALGLNSSQGGGSSTLAELLDVEISSPTDGQVLKYDSATGKWVNGSDEGISSVSWASITGKPSTFAPSAHNHDDRYYIQGGTIHLGGSQITPLTSYTEQYTGTVTQVKIGTVAYDPVSGVVTLPEYPSFSYTLPKATATKLGGIKVGYEGNGKNYAVVLDANGNAYVSVPWTDTDTDTTYSSLAAVNGGTDVSLVTTGEKYTWNNKQDAIGDLATIRSNASDGKSAYDTLQGIMGTDSDQIINKWEEVVAFLDTYTEADTLANLLGNKADKVAKATNGNFAALDANGNLTDSGHKHSDYLTSHQTLYTLSVYGGTTKVLDFKPNANASLYIKAGTGLSLTADTTNKYITLSLADISATYATRNWVGQNYVSIAFFNSLFEAETSGGATVAPNNAASATIARLKILVGAYTDQYLSALGLSDNQSAAGGDVYWSALGTYDGSHSIDLRYLDLSAYALKTDIPSLANYALKSEIPTTMAWTSITGKPSTFPPSAHTHVWSDITNRPTKLSDFTNDLDIPSAYELPAATATKLGGIKIGYTESGKNYAVQLDANNKAYVSVPWTDTTYSSKTAVRNGNEVSLVTTGEKYAWSNPALSVAADNGTNALTLSFGAKYKLTVGGSTFIFTMPTESDPNVPAWAKADTKPTYGFSEITGTLAESQIPTLAISKISGLQAALNAKMDIVAFERLFQAIASDGTTKVAHPYPASSVASIKAMFGLWTEQYLSALGLSSNQGSGGTDIETVWTALGNSTSEQINATHLSTALAGYATEQWVTQNFALKGDIPTMATLTWSGYSSGSYDGSAAASITIPSNTNQLTNGAGFVTSSGVTSITLKAGTGISLDTDNTAITSTGTRTITNAGVRAVSISGNSLRVNTNGTNADLTIPYATAAGSAPASDVYAWAKASTKPSYSFGEITGSILNSQMNAGINNLTVGTSDPTDNDYYIAQYAGGGTQTTTYHRRAHSALYNYIQGKTDGRYLKLTGGTLTGLLTANAGITIPSTQSLTIGSCTITYDTGSGMLHFSTGIYSDGAVSALGVGSSSGSGGGLSWSNLQAATSEQINYSHLTSALGTALTNYVTLTGNQSIFGDKTFHGDLAANGEVFLGVNYDPINLFVDNALESGDNSELNLYVYEGFFVEKTAGQTGTLLGVNYTSAQFGVPLTVNGNLTVSSGKTVTASGFVHRTYNTGDYLLTGNGGAVYKQGLFSAMSVSGTTLSVTIGGTNKTVTLPSGATVPTNISAFTNDSGYITSSALSSYLPLSGGTMTYAGAIRWAVTGNKSRQAFLGYTDVDGTFGFSVEGTNYQSGLVIGGTSGNLLWKGNRVLTVADTSSSLMTTNSNQTIYCDKTFESYRKLCFGSTDDYITQEIDGLDFHTQLAWFSNEVMAQSFNDTSDARRKQLLGSTTLTVEQIAAMPAVKFRWLSDNAATPHVGTLAQAWQTVLPEAVKQDRDGWLTMNYGAAALVSVITTARRVVDHERRISELERENQRLREEILKIED